MSVKTRDLWTRIQFPYATWNGISGYGGGKREYRGFQYTESEGHRRSRDGKFREGGPFYTARVSYDINTAHLELENTDGSRKYSGPVMVPVPESNYDSHLDIDTDSSYLDQYGTEAIAAVDPTNPNAQAGVALGEIVRDRRLPIPGYQTWRRRTEVAKAAGGEYLNAVFGWLPLVRDMKNTAQSVMDGNTILENYRGAAGTDVHREFAFPDIVSESESVIERTIPKSGSSFSDFHNGVVPLTLNTRTVTRRWFSGAFTYTSDSGGSSVGKMLGYGSDAQKLFGLSLTPDLVWELTPWSWAIDWFSNASSVIHNLGSFGLAGLAMRYGYIMETVSTVITYSMPSYPYIIKGKATPTPIPSSSIVITTKRRREASPFGFGLQWDGFSPTQLAITAALGITRLR